MGKQLVFNNTNNLKKSFFVKIKNVIKELSIFSLLREILWKSFFKKCNMFLEWVNSFKPDYIWVVGGKTWFDIKIALYLKQTLNCKIVYQLTDDYFRRLNSLGFSGIHKHFLEKWTKRILENSKCLVTIGNYMTSVYSKKYGVKCYEIMNCISDFETFDSDNRDCLVITYAGSLYYGRDKIIVLILKAIKNIVLKYSHKVILKVYSKDKLKCPNELKKYLYKGSYLGPKDLSHELNNSDILLFVESFKKNTSETLGFLFQQKYQSIWLKKNVYLQLDLMK